MKVIALQNVSFTYDKNIPVIKNASISFYRDEFTAIMGDNGSGKTTLGKLMAGILKPSHGRVMMMGKDSKSMSLGEIGIRIGYLFQNPDKQLFAATVEEEIAFSLEMKGYEKEQVNRTVEEMLELFQLQQVREVFPFQLSHGEKQRLALAALLADHPRYLILDEPTTGLDIQRKKVLSKVLEKLMDKGVGMTVISHDRDFIEAHAARIIVLSKGEMIDDIREESRSQS